MRILFGSAHPYLPQIYGGAQTSTHELATELSKAGHEVAVLAGLTGEKWLGLQCRIALKLGRKRYVPDVRMGYTTYRAWFPHEVAADVARDFGADVVVLQSGLPVQLAEALAPTGIPCFIYLRNVELNDLGGDITALDKVGFIANSHFTDQRFYDLFGLSSAVIYPLVRPERYATITTRRTVTFINPHPCKGLDIAAEVARRCPDIPFTFVRAWTLSPAEETTLQSRISPLANVTLRPATSDMKSVYRDSGLMLVPSQWEEAFGRVATEAQFSGIPVVGSRCGGLPEAIGRGGTLVAPAAPVESWVTAIRDLWDDAAAYRTASAAALKHSRRPEMNTDSQIADFLRVISQDPVAAAPVRHRDRRVTARKTAAG